MILREALPADYTQVIELIKELAVFEKEPDAVTIDADYLRHAAAAQPPQFKCYVALVDDKIVGMSLCYTRFSTWKGTTIHLEDLIITQSMRGKGIGKALYDAVLNYAHKLNVQRVEWVVLDWNKNAIDFYEKTGATIIKDWYLAQMDREALTQYLGR